LTKADTTQTIAGVRVLTEPTCALLGGKTAPRSPPPPREFLSWLLTRGKKPDEFRGYAETTVKRTAYDPDAFYHWVWAEEEGYTLGGTHDHADQYFVSLLERPRSLAGQLCETPKEPPQIVPLALS
jgi:hypothetical protein